MQAPLAFRDFEGNLGREDSLYAVHNAIVRAAQTIRPIVESGAVFAACSDEFNGEVRTAFASDVARLLTGPHVPGHRRVFAVSNLGGRIEPGAIALADQHFTARTAAEGEKLLLVEIAGHVGRRDGPSGPVWGELDRFGAPSPCCGALRLLLDEPAGHDSVRFPWFEQLSAFFGPERLNALRGDASSHQMLRAAIVHAVLQSETALVDLMRDPPSTSTHVLLAAVVVVNRRGTDNAIPVALHHLFFRGGEPEIRFGASLRSTPAALAIDASQSNLRVSSPHGEPRAGAGAPRVPPLPPRIPAPALHTQRPQSTIQRAEARSEGVQAHVREGRRRLEAIEKHPGLIRVYARPLLRAFVQGLSIVAPEVALAAFPLELVGEWVHAHHVRQLLARGPSTEEARRLLRELEPALQQLGHAEAREVLQALLARHHPLLGER